MKESIQPHTSVVLFYKYFLCEPDEFGINGETVDSNSHRKLLLIQRYSDYYVEKLRHRIKNLCTKLHLKGRILLATEGINGTISGFVPSSIHQFISEMESIDLRNEFALPPNIANGTNVPISECLFQGIDWKISSTNSTCPVRPSRDDVIVEPFPDLKVSVVNEIISTGGTVSIEDIVQHGGTHLSPSEFHQCIIDHPDSVLIDVRNTFEHAIGHFFHPSTQEPALNPEMVHFSTFDDTFCSVNANDFRGKKVLIYCTGGIRCEKASVMLKQRGISDVSQLSGGIHRYLESYGSTGFFRGKNFVFDQRIVQNPLDYNLSNVGKQHNSKSAASIGKHGFVSDGSISERNDIVGVCLECQAKYDELCGSRLCTVCRDLVLVCPDCRCNLREYHCARHSTWKSFYFTFLEVFDQAELLKQHEELVKMRNIYLPASKKYRNVRRTLTKQMAKVLESVTALDSGVAICDRFAPRRCRTCMEADFICDGKCWGFWKTSVNRRVRPNETDIPPLPVGTIVEPGPNWNELRLGSKLDATSGLPLRGFVVEIKSWGSGGTEFDCAAVSWINPCNEQRDQSSPLIYRWGAIALNGKRMYDLQQVSQSSSC
jgi:predicted sulfurtransferase